MKKWILWSKNPFSFQTGLTQDFCNVFFPPKKHQKPQISYITVISMFENVQKCRKVKIGFVTPLDHCGLRAITWITRLACMPTRLSRLAKLRRSTKRNMLWYLIYFFTSFTKKVYEITLRKYIHPQQCTVVQFWSLPFRKSTMKIGNLQNCPLYPFLHAGNYLEIWFLYCLTNPN